MIKSIVFNSYTYYFANMIIRIPKIGYKFWCVRAVSDYGSENAYMMYSHLKVWDFEIDIDATLIRPIHPTYLPIVCIRYIIFPRQHVFKE